MFTMLLYILVAIVAMSSVGANQLSQVTNTTATPLKLVASNFHIPGSSQIMARCHYCHAKIVYRLSAIGC